VTGPDGMIFNFETGAIEWQTNTTTDPGDYLITIKAEFGCADCEDVTGESAPSFVAYQNYTLDVQPFVEPPPTATPTATRVPTDTPTPVPTSTSTATPEPTPVPQKAEIRFAPDPVTIVTGGLVNVELVAHEVENLDHYQITILYDEMIAGVQDVVAGQLFESSGQSFATAPDVFPDSSGKLVLSADSTIGEVSGTGTLATITFQCNAPGTSILSVNVDVFEDESNNLVSHLVTTGLLQGMLPDYDLDQGGSVDVEDLLILIRSMRQQGDVDINGDGLCNQQDLFLFCTEWGKEK